MSLHEGVQVTDRFFVAGGFSEITAGRCTVLADTATPVAELSRQDGETRLRDAEQAYEQADKSDITTLEPLLDRIQSARAWVETAEAG